MVGQTLLGYLHAPLAREVLLRAAAVIAPLTMLQHALRLYDVQRTLLLGEQQQRLRLARALFGQPTQLILDESLSMLPPEDETDILKAIHTHSKPAPTILCLTHREHVIAMADTQ